MSSQPPFSSAASQTSPSRPFHRQQVSLLLGRLQEPPKFIQILAGPRQVGKTTVVQQVAQRLGDRVLYAAADLSAAPTNQWITQQWARAMVQNGNNKTTQPFVLILDEI